MFTKDMWLRGIWLQNKLADRYPDDLRINHLISCIQIHKEISEVLDAFPWKFERNLPEVPRENLIIELVDVFKYFMRLLIIHNVTEEEFQAAFDKKSDIVERRLLNGITYNDTVEKSVST